MGCFYYEECNLYNDVYPYDTVKLEVEVSHASMELCKGRHATPAQDGAIYENEVDPTDPVGLEKQALERLKALNITSLNLYVTGLTVALIAVLNAARTLNIEVCLHHFDRISGSYFWQEVK